MTEKVTTDNWNERNVRRTSGGILREEVRYVLPLLRDGGIHRSELVVWKDDSMWRGCIEATTALTIPQNAEEAKKYGAAELLMYLKDVMSHLEEVVALQREKHG